jgi:hypothetical protein
VLRPICRFNKAKKLTNWHRPRFSVWYSLPEALQRALEPYGVTRLALEANKTY